MFTFPVSESEVVGMPAALCQREAVRSVGGSPKAAAGLLAGQKSGLSPSG